MDREDLRLYVPPETLPLHVGQGQSETGHAPLEIPRTAKHLILDLPIGSKEGPYEVGLLTEAGDQILRATGTAQLHDHITDLRVDIDLTVAFRLGHILSGFDRPLLEVDPLPISHAGCFDLLIPIHWRLPDRVLQFCPQ